MTSVRIDGLTIIYYTANRIDDNLAEWVRGHLLKTTLGQIPIISVSQKPLVGFGRNLYVGEKGFSTYWLYWQILAGARLAETRYVACCEDDALYSSGHFDYRPPDDRFGYNLNRWTLDPDGNYRWRDRTCMSGCIAPTALLVAALEERFIKYPAPLSRDEMRGWGEPGRYDRHIGVTQRWIERYKSAMPIVTLNHRDSLGGLRKCNPTDISMRYLEPFGDGMALLREMHDIKPQGLA